MRRLRRVLVTVLALAGAAAILLGILAVMGGFTARARASRLERGMAELLRDAATPRSAKNLRSPIVGTPDVLTRARHHFATECATCHGNDGRGAEFGKRMFPPVPDLRDDTRDLTEGEIFWIIENGIRWSGMPAMGEPDGSEAQGHWEVVYFIRHLPDLTAGEIEEMKRLNPRPPEAGAEEEGAPVHEGHVHGHGTPAPEAPSQRAPPRRPRR